MLVQMGQAIQKIHHNSRLVGRHDILRLHATGTCQAAVMTIQVQATNLTLSSTCQNKAFILFGEGNMLLEIMHIYNNSTCQLTILIS